MRKSPYPRICLWSNGATSTHPTPEAVRSAVRRRKTAGLYKADSWPESDPPPRGGSAEEWDAYRARRGYAGGHH